MMFGNVIGLENRLMVGRVALAIATETEVALRAGCWSEKCGTARVGFVCKQAGQRPNNIHLSSRSPGLIFFDLPF